MTQPERPEVPEEAVEALAKSQHERDRVHNGARCWEALSRPVRRSLITRAGDGLADALPAIQAALLADLGLERCGECGGSGQRITHARSPETMSCPTCKGKGYIVPKVAGECESCDDSGIYTEGAEWAPCGECERGREFGHHLKIARDEATAAVEERVRGELEPVVEAARRVLTMHYGSQSPSNPAAHALYSALAALSTAATEHQAAEQETGVAAPHTDKQGGGEG